jgi:hypothetical protein
MFLVGRHQKRNLAAAVEVDDNTRTLETKLEPAVMLFGRIADPNGKGIADVEVRTMMRGPRWGSTLGRKPAVTDNDGKYEIHAMPPGRTYNVYARAEGYGESRSDQVNSENAVDRRVDMGILTLAVANLSVSGVVIDEDGKPVAGARVSCYGDDQPHRNSRTDTEGKFTLDKVCTGKMRISASKTSGMRLYGNVETEGGATDIRIVISQRSSSTRYQPKRPPSLIGRPLKNLDDLNIKLTSNEIDGKRVLVCFCDMQQRPSRHYLMQLAKQAGKLKDKGVVTIIVQSSQMDETMLAQVAKKHKIPFPVGMVQSSFEKASFRWGIRSLPWLILTDTHHIITAAGSYRSMIDKLNQP